MARYIELDAVLAIIKQLKDEAIAMEDKARWFLSAALVKRIEALEVKEVDLEKEIDTWYQNKASKEFEKVFYEDIEDCAKHFFELGLKARIDKELVEEVYSHIDSIKDTADRMTSGNFMHNRAAIKFSANTIANVLELIGIKVQKVEKA